MKKKLDFDNLFKNLKETWKYVKKYKKNLYIYIFISLMMAGIGALAPYFSSKLLLYLTDGKFNLLLLIAFVVLISEVLRNFLRIFSLKVYTLVFKKITLNIRMDIVREVFSLGTSEFDNNSSGVFIDRIGKDCGSLSSIFDLLSHYLINIVMNLGVLVAIFFINKIMCLYIILTFIILYFVERIRILKRNENRKEWLKLGEVNTGLSNEFIRGIRDVKALNVEDGFAGIINNKLYDVYYKEYELINMDSKFMFFSNSLDYLLAFAFIGLGIILSTNNLLSIENFVIIYMYKDRANRLIWEFVAFVETLKDFNLSADRVFEIVRNDTYKKEKFGDYKLDDFKGNIEFKNLNFSYNDNNTVLKDVSFNILEGKTVSFVGKSGSGKSTIASLVNKMYEVDDDSIFFDGIDINLLDKESIRGNIALVTQNPYLFNLSVVDNFRLIKKDATIDEIKDVCKLAAIHEDIINLENGYDTIIGEGGVVLSGGQRQRIAIARALLKNAKVLIFDEATSALDNETQKSVKEAIDNIRGTHTVIIIAHRLSTVVNSDVIYFLKNGKIIDYGTHKQLLKKCKEYKKLYENEE